MRTLVSCFLVAIGMAFGGAARADELLEQGDTYFVVRHDATAGGSVYMRVEWTPAMDAIQTTVLGVEADDGWTYQVYSPGGINTAVEVRFESRRYRVRFKALYEPGKTVIDYGELKKR